jgi:hypothetical protein
MWSRLVLTGLTPRHITVCKICTPLARMWDHRLAHHLSCRNNISPAMARLRRCRCRYWLQNHSATGKEFEGCGIFLAIKKCMSVPLLAGVQATAGALCSLAASKGCKIYSGLSYRRAGMTHFNVMSFAFGGVRLVH